MISLSTADLKRIIIIIFSVVDTVFIFVALHRCNNPLSLNAVLFVASIVLCLKGQSVGGCRLLSVGGRQWSGQWLHAVGNTSVACLYPWPTEMWFCSVIGLISELVEGSGSKTLPLNCLSLVIVVNRLNQAPDSRVVRGCVVWIS